MWLNVPLANAQTGLRVAPGRQRAQGRGPSPDVLCSPCPGLPRIPAPRHLPRQRGRQAPSRPWLDCRAGPAGEAGRVGAAPSSLQNDPDASSPCKQDIGFCQRDHKQLEVSLRGLSLPLLSSLALSARRNVQAGRKRWRLGRRSSTPRSPASSRAAAAPRSWTPSWPWASRCTPREYRRLQGWGPPSAALRPRALTSCASGRPAEQDGVPHGEPCPSLP